MAVKKKLVDWRKPEELVHHRLQSQPFCPSCFIMLDGVTKVSGKGKSMPEPGDFTLCLNCGAVLEYDANMQVISRTLMDIPMHSRMGFAQAVTEIKNRGPIRRDRTTRIF